VLLLLLLLVRGDGGRIGGGGLVERVLGRVAGLRLPVPAELAREPKLRLRLLRPLRRGVARLLLLRISSSSSSRLPHARRNRMRQRSRRCASSPERFFFVFF